MMQRPTDRINDLDDSVLGLILCSVPSTKDAFKTSILSKRWKSVWTYVRAIHVKDSDKFCGWGLDCRIADATKIAFMNWADRFLLSSSLPLLQKLCLSCSFFYDISRVQQWIDTIISLLHNDNADLKELEIMLSSSQQLAAKLSHTIFTSKKLVVLKLTVNVEVDLPLSVAAAAASLPCLKVLHLSILKTGIDASSVENILTCCPLLEEFYFEGYTHDKFNRERFCLKSSSLKRLSIASHCLRDPILTFEIDACNLENFVLFLDKRNPIVIANTSLPFLTTVKLDIRDFQPNDKDVTGNILIEILRKVSAATKYLYLSSRVVVCLEYGGFYQQVPVFTNLVHLDLKAYSSSLPVIPCFLKNSPNIVSFTLSINDYLPSPFGLQQSPITLNYFLMAAQNHHLDKVELSNYGRRGHEMELVTYILKNAPVLKKMILKLESRVSFKVATRFCNRIRKLPKASIGCQVTGTVQGDNGWKY